MAKRRKLTKAEAWHRALAQMDQSLRVFYRHPFVNSADVAELLAVLRLRAPGLPKKRVKIELVDDE